MPMASDCAQTTRSNARKERRTMEILVTGGTGKAGRQMVEALAAAGLRVRVGSRHPGTSTESQTPVNFD